MHATAAVLRDQRSFYFIEEIELAAPGPGEPTEGPRN
jgi:hypothetical protein